MYEELGTVANRTDIILVKNSNDGQLYIKKYIKDYNLSVYEYLQDNPVANMPRLISVFEGSNNLVIIEEYISGSVLNEVLAAGPLEIQQALEIAIKLCRILCEIHNRPQVMIHRDIKPSNVILTNDGNVYLLDINAAKWCKPEEVEDTYSKIIRLAVSLWHRFFSVQ